MPEAVLQPPRSLNLCRLVRCLEHLDGATTFPKSCKMGVQHRTSVSALCTPCRRFRKRAGPRPLPHNLRSILNLVAAEGRVMMAAHR